MWMCYRSDRIRYVLQNIIVIWIRGVGSMTEGLREGLMGRAFGEEASVVGL
jgi:hypothetical protein